MAKLNTELKDSHPNLNSLGIKEAALKRYRVFEATTSIGRRIAIPYLTDCTKLINWDGTSIWDGEYAPEAGLFGQKQATTRHLILCSHEFEALRLASVFPNHDTYSFVALPTVSSLGPIAIGMLLESLREVADVISVWNGSYFADVREVFEQFVTGLDAGGGIIIKSISMGRDRSPLMMTNDEIIRAVDGDHSTWTPSSLATADEIFRSESFMKPTIGLSTGITELDRFVKGIRKSEVWMYVAGSGSGKSTLIRQQLYNLAYIEGQTVLMVFLEETRDESLKKLASIHYNIPYEQIQSDPEHALGPKKWAAFLNHPGTKRLRFLARDSKDFGGIDIDTLLNAARYMKRKGGLDFIGLDHISIMISGKESSKEGERRDIDILMTKLAMGAVGLEVGILAVCHLSNPEGKPHENGGQVFLQHMRGSGSLKQLSWTVIASERDQQAENNRLVVLRVLKNRNGGGMTGLAGVLEFRDPLLVERTDLKAADVRAEWEGRQTSRRRPDDTGARVRAGGPFGTGGKTKRFGTLSEQPTLGDQPT